MGIELILLAFLFLLILHQMRSLTRPKNFPPGNEGSILGYLPFLAPDSHVKIGEVGKKYGKIFSLKLGQYWLVVLNDFELIRTAFKKDVFSGRPNHLLAMAFMKKGIAYNYGSVWQEQRRFSLKALRDFGLGRVSMETSIQEEVRDLVENLRQKANTPTELTDIYAVSILNALWNIVAGTKFSSDDPLPRKVYAAARQGYMEPEIQGPVYFLPWLVTLFPESTGLTAIREGVKTMTGLLRDVIAEHQSTFIPGSRARDFIDVYLQQMADDENNPDSSFFKDEGILNLIDVLTALFVAGADTLSSTLGFACLYLTAHPEIQRKLHDEIDKVIGRKRSPDPSDRQSMPYTEAVLLEVFRLSSIVAGSILHSTTEDTEFMGYSLPKGTIIMPNLYQVHHDEKYWDEPESFKPDRFLNPDGSFRKDERVIPFSTGKRVCMAESLAQVELFLFFTGIFQAFELEAHPDHPLPPFKAKSSFVMSPPHHHKIQV